MTDRAYATRLVTIARAEQQALLFALHKGNALAADTARRFRNAHLRFARQFAQ